MDTDALETKLREAFSAEHPQDLATLVTELASEDLVQEWPQSGERIRGIANIRAVNEGYEGATGTAPNMTLRRLTRPGSAWVVEATIDYGDGTPVSLVSILETDDAGKIVRETDYFANPFDAPAWRAALVEQMGPVAG